jgi:hypothetical protein
VLAAAAPYQLAPLPGRANSVGVAGYTLGGGTGWLSRKHGFAADSVLWAEVVTAGGETLTASATEHPDLFWALRGGGGNFGVVTGLRFELYPVARVYAGMSWHPADRAAPAGPFPAGRPRGGGHGPAVAGRRPRSAIPTCRSGSPRWPPTTEATSGSGSTRPWTG